MTAEVGETKNAVHMDWAASKFMHTGTYAHALFDKYIPEVSLGAYAPGKMPDRRDVRLTRLEYGTLVFLL